MAIITISIIESDLRLVAGIPDSITVETNIPTNIFYTLNGSDPNQFSMIVTGPIKLPTDINTVFFKCIATDGIDWTPVVSQKFGTSTAGLRNSHDKITNIDLMSASGFPFSSVNTTPTAIYLNTGGITVNDSLEEQIPDGYDGTATGTPSNYTNQPVYSYDLVFSQTDSIGQMGKGIGTVPASVTIIRDEYNEPPQQSNAESAFFDPRAMVIFQDASIEPYDPDMPMVNRPYFNLENENTARDGMLRQMSIAQPPMGSFLRQHFNPKDNTIQFSYWDSRTNRWIISKVPFTPKNSNIGNYAQVVMPSSSKPGSRYVFKWIPFQYRRLIT